VIIVDDFEPPKPPKGEKADSENLMNDKEDKKEDVSNKKPTKKRKGLFKLFKKSKKNKQESDSSALEAAQKMNFDSIDLNDELNGSATVDDLDKDADLAEGSSDFEEDLLSENTKDVKIEGDGTLLEEFDAIEPEPSMKEDDLENIRAALGVEESNKKSIREEFEDNPESFNEENNEEDWLTKEFEETDGENPSVNNEDEHFDKDLLEIVDDEALSEKLKEEEIPPNEEKIKLFEDEIDLEHFDEGKLEGEEKLSFEEDSEVEESLVPEESPVLEQTSESWGGLDIEEDSAISEDLNVEEADEELKTDLPVFDDADEDEGKYSKEFNKKIETSFIKFNNLTEKKIEKLIKDAAAKKKSALLDKDREKILLVNFEQELKKTISNNIDSIKKEELKVVDKISKKAENLDKKDAALNKKTEVLESKKEKIEQDMQKAENKLKDLEKNLNDKEEELIKIESKYDDKKAKISLLEDDKKAINNEIKELKASLSEIKKNHKKEVDESAKKLNELKTKTKNEEEKLKKTKEKVEAELKKISEKEKEIDNKSENLKKLIEEEKNVLTLLKKENITEEKSSNVFEEKSISEGFSSHDSLLDKIDECNKLIEQNKLDVAKRKYNGLRKEFMAGVFSNEEKNVLKEKLKDLFNSISNS
jgi:hypothetical protein